MAKTAKESKDSKDNVIRTDEELVAVINMCKSDKASLDKEIKMCEALLLQSRHLEIQTALKEKSEPYGVVHLGIGNHDVEINTPKKITYDQKKLKEIRDQIISDGANPDVYIQTEYSISETTYKNWDEETKSFFRDARTIQPGSVSIKIKEKE